MERDFLFTGGGGFIASGDLMAFIDFCFFQRVSKRLTGDVSRSSCISADIEHSEPISGSASVRLEVIRDIAALRDIRDFWTSCPGHRDSDIDLFSMIIDSRPEAVRPHVIALYRNGRPEALLAGRIDETVIKFEIGYKRLWPMKARVLRLVRGGLRGTLVSDNCRHLVNEVRQCLRNGEADLAIFESLEAGSPILSLARRLPGFMFSDHLPVNRRRWIRSLPPVTGPWICDSYADCLEKCNTIGAKNCPIILSESIQRHRWRTLLSRYRGKVRIECFCQVKDVNRLISDVETVARKSYQRAIGVGFVDTADIRERLLLEAKHGWLRGYVLYVEDRPWAYWIGSWYDYYFHADWTGYDPDYGKFSPGMYLITRAICDIWKQCGGASGASIDFGCGESQWKAALSNQRRDGWEVRIYSPTPKGALMNALRTVAVLVNRIGITMLEKGHWLSALKRHWRERRRRGVNDDGHSQRLAT